MDKSPFDWQTCGWRSRVVRSNALRAPPVVKPLRLKTSLTHSSHKQKNSALNADEFSRIGKIEIEGKETNDRLCAVFSFIRGLQCTINPRSGTPLHRYR